MTITEPVALYDLDEVEYHADRLLPERSLSSTMAKTIISPGGPARLREIMLNGQPRKPEWDFGSAAHQRILGRGQPVIAIEGDRRKKDVRDAITKAETAGSLVVKPEELESIERMAAAILDHPLAAELLTAGQGKPEVSMFGLDQATGRWLRGRLDFLHSRQLIVDYKTTASANPGDFERSAWNFGYHIQAAHYLNLAYALDLVDPGAEYLLVAQEKRPPYLPHVYRISDELLDHGHRDVARAVALWDRCMSLDDWPGLPHEPTTLTPPRWATLTEREDA